MCEFKTFYGDTCLEGKELLEAKIEHPIELEYYKTYTNIAEKRNTIYGVEIVKKEYMENEVMKESKEINLLTFSTLTSKGVTGSTLVSTLEAIRPSSVYIPVATTIASIFPATKTVPE